MINIELVKIILRDLRNDDASEMQYLQNVLIELDDFPIQDALKLARQSISSLITGFKNRDEHMIEMQRILGANPDEDKE